ncbi:MAG: hypothetical protein JXA99_00925 [Candidatus Lokiarchaeota archaeon]|nr:hypothetical protein [Candidatus Lokiarchaeota archaeon]
MKIKKQHFISIIVIFSVISILFITNFSSSHLSEEGNNYSFPKTSEIHPSYIYTNDTDNTLVSIFEAINYTVDAQDFPTFDSMEMRISFIDGTSELYPMARIGSTSNFTVAYAPDYNTPSGRHNITFYIYNDVLTLLNNQVVDTYLTIESQYYSVTFNKDEYHIGDILYGTILVSNVSSYTFETYQMKIVNSTETPQDLIYSSPQNNIKYFNITINREDFVDLNKEYYVKLTLIDGSKTGDIYIPFMISNYDPEILVSTLELSAGESSLNPIYRSDTDNCYISVNVTDIESSWIYLNVSVVVYKPDGLILEEISLVGDENNFTAEFHIGIGNPIGRYRFQINAEDPDGGLGEYYKEGIRVENNIPEIHSYELNGHPMTDSISVFYGDDIIFDTFNITDVEGNIEYITVSLINENDEWYNKTTHYTPSLTIRIRSVDLISGVWTVYITVIDADGDSTGITYDYGDAPTQITIVPDTLSKIIPYLTLIVGGIIGLLLGIGVGYRMLKFRAESKITESKKKQIPIKKKITESKSKKTQIKEEKSEIEEEKETSQPVKKKIKRRL